MPWKYAFQKFEKEKMAKAMARFVPVSTKISREICNFIKGKNLFYAIAYLQKVAEKEMPIPYKRYCKSIPHRKGMAAGRYPAKTVVYFLDVLDNALANAKAKNLDIVKLNICHAVCHRALSKQRRRGKWTHIEVVVEEAEDKKEKPRKEIKKEAKKTKEAKK